MKTQIMQSLKARNTPLSETGSTSGVHAIPPSFSFGNSFIEITALTTLIGSTSAESLILGNHGPAGLAWGTMSSFGLLWVIRSCLAAASPAWLREMISIRTTMTDMAVGMAFEADSRWTRKARKTESHPVGIMVDSESLKSASKSRKSSNISYVFKRWADVYAFDRSISGLVSTIPDNSSNDTTVSISNPKQNFTIHTYGPHAFRYEHNIKFQVSAVTLSLAKVSECFLLWNVDARLLSIITALPWAYFLTAAVLFETHSLMFLQRLAEPYGPIDILAGGLPTMIKQGGSRKVIIGAGRNFRHSVWWRIMWVLGATVCIGSLLATYMVVGSQPNRVVFIWAGYQAFWLFARLLVYHFAGHTNWQTDRRVLVERPWSTLSADFKERVLNLMVGLAEYMVVVHPRQALAYQGDVFLLAGLRSILLNSLPIATFPVSSGAAGSIEIEIAGVIGDTILHSAAWMTGWPLTNIELYDCAILSINLPSSLAKSAIKRVHLPVVRALSGSGASLDSDVENVFPKFSPKGAPNLGGKGVWYYWIPYESGGWLVLTHIVGTTFIRKHTVTCMTDIQVTKILSAGNLCISLSDADELWKTLEICRRAKKNLTDLLNI